MLHVDTWANNQVQLAGNVFHRGSVLPLLFGNDVAVAHTQIQRAWSEPVSSWTLADVVQWVLQSERGLMHPHVEEDEQSLLRAGLTQTELLSFFWWLSTCLSWQLLFVKC